MLCCCRERKTEECGSVNSGSPNLRLRRSRHNFEHSSLSMSDAGACGGASRRLSVASREHGPPSTSFLHRTCERQRVPGATILWGMGDERNRLSCPPNAHSKLQTAPRACPTAAGRVPRLTKNSEGAMCTRHAAEQFRAARGGSAAGPTDRRFVSL